MDPNQFNFYNFMQNCQPPPTSENSQNPTFYPNYLPQPMNSAMFPPQSMNPTMFPPPSMNRAMSYRPPMNTVEIPQTPVESMPESQVPQFSTQVGLEDIVLNEGGGNSGRKKLRVKFTPEEDILLVQSWLNVSKDPIIGVDQKANSFWLRVKEGYNEYRQHLRAREVTQIKSRWHKLSNAVQKFVGCYKHAAGRYVSGRSDMDIMVEAHAMYFHDVKHSFKFERIWRLLKDEPKWTMDQSIDSSSNPATPTSFEKESPSESNGPMGQKAAKRKGKEKVAETSSNIIDLTGIKASLKDKNAAMIKIAETKESENI